MSKATTIEEYTAENRAAIDDWNKAHAECSRLIKRIKYASGARLERLCERYDAMSARRAAASKRQQATFRRLMRAMDERLAVFRAPTAARDSIGKTGKQEVTA